MSWRARSPAASSRRPHCPSRTRCRRGGTGLVSRLSSCPALPSSLKLRRPSELVARRSLGGDGCRASTSFALSANKDVDGRDKPGHDDKLSNQSIEMRSCQLSADGERRGERSRQRLRLALDHLLDPVVGRGGG